MRKVVVHIVQMSRPENPSRTFSLGRVTPPRPVSPVSSGEGKGEEK
jgi:hypothetical protein